MNLDELRRQHVRDHVIPEACVTDREPWPCTIAQLLATAEPGEAGHAHIAGWCMPCVDEGARVAESAPVADAGMDAAKDALIAAVRGMADFYEWDGIPLDQHGIPGQYVIERLHELDARLAAAPTEPPRPYLDMLDTVEPPAETLGVDRLARAMRARDADWFELVLSALRHGDPMGLDFGAWAQIVATEYARLTPKPEPPVNGNGFTPEQQKAVDAAANDVIRAHDEWVAAGKPETEQA